MRRRLLSPLLISCLAAGLAGCEAPPQTDEPTLQRVTARSAEEMDVLWEAIDHTLHDWYFTPDRQDRLAGVVTTHPETSTIWFELWRPQPRPAYYWIEANTQTIQRKAEVRIRPADEPEVYELDAVIRRYKFNLEERQVDSAAAALRLYGAEAPTYSGEIRRRAESGYWTDVGRDHEMEHDLLLAILARFEKDLALAAEAAAAIDDAGQPDRPAAPEEPDAPDKESRINKINDCHLGTIV